MPIFTVRADSGRHTDAFRQGGYIGIGWFTTLVDDTGSREAIRARYRDDFAGHSVGTASQNVGQLHRFFNVLQPGDLILTPYGNSPQQLLVGHLQPGPAYFVAPGTDGCRYCYRRPVRWLPQTLNRRDFGQALQNTLGSVLTVFTVPQEQEIRDAVAGTPARERRPAAQGFGPAQAHEAVRQRLLALDPGEFEVLVGYALRVLGFDGHVTRQSGDGGIDFEGELRVHGVAQIKLQVQAKKYTATQINETALRSFRGALRHDHQGCFITLSDFSGPARRSAEDAALRPINLINGRQFVELFVEHYGPILKLMAEEEADDLAQKLQFQKALLPG